MKKTAWKRTLSLFLTVSLLLSLCCGLLVSVFALRRPHGTNSATRDNVCTALSAQANAYYTAGVNDYATISAMTGVYAPNDSWLATQNNPIYSTLQTLMDSTYEDINIYYYGTRSANYDGNGLASGGSLAYYWNYSDAEQNSNEYLYFYCDTLPGNVQNTEGYNRNGMEREHVWCKSKADYEEDAGTGGADLHHLRPSFGQVNGVKSNQAFGNMPNGTDLMLDGVSVFRYDTTAGESGRMEVNDNIKGDVARILLYVYCRWGQPNLYTSYSAGTIASKLRTAGINTAGTITGNDDGTKIIENLDTLLDWCELDPVDDWEMQQNDEIENIQGNRNVFIDYPEYAWMMFDRPVPMFMQTPSNMAMANSVHITAQTNDPAKGTVSVSASTITATAAAGCYVDNVTVVSGSAEVTMLGTGFETTPVQISVVPHSDCDILVTFATRSTVSVSFAVPYGVTQPAAQSVLQGEPVTLPSCVGTPAADAHPYQFVGWVDAAVTDTDTRPVMYAPGDAYTVTGNVTMKALYTYNMTGTSPDYMKVSDINTLALPADCLIAYETGQRIFNGALPTLDAANNNVQVPVSGSVIAAADGDPYRFTLSAMNSDYSICSNSGKYILASSPSANGLLGQAAPAANEITVDAAGNVNICSKTCFLRFNSTSGQMRFRYYQASSYTNQKAIQLYVKGTAIVVPYFTTEVSYAGSCPHNNTTTSTQPATCTENGYTRTECIECGTTVSDIPIPMMGHDLVAGSILTAPTCIDPGTQEMSCTRCSYTETAVLPATGNHTFNTTSTVPATCTATGSEMLTCTVCGDVIQTTLPALGHDFSGQAVSRGAIGHRRTCQRSGCTAEQNENHTYMTIHSAGDEYIRRCKYCGYSIRMIVGPVRYEFTLVDCAVSRVADKIAATTMSLPGCQPPQGYSFAGWTENAFEGEVGEVKVYSAESDYVPTQDTELYAVYSRTEKGGDYVLAERAEQLRPGSEIVIAAATSQTALGKADGTGRAPSLAYREGTQLLPQSSNLTVFTLCKGFSENTFGLYDAANGTYLSVLTDETGAVMGLTQEKALTDRGCFRIRTATDGSCSITCGTGEICFYDGPDFCGFRCIKTGATKYSHPVSAYVKTQDETFYTIYPDVPQTVTVSFVEQSAPVNTVSVNVGETISLPEQVSDVPGFCFAGWSTQPIRSRAEDVELLNGTYAPTADIKLFAVYARTAEKPASSDEVYTLVREPLCDWSGEYAVTDGKASALSADLCAQKMNIQNGAAEIRNPDSDLVFRLEKAKDGYSVSGCYGFFGVSTDCVNGCVVTQKCADTFTVEACADGYALRSGATGRILSFRSGMLRALTAPGNLTGCLYRKGADATMVYTTEPQAEACKHSEIDIMDQRDATQTCNGYTGNLVCADCGKVLKYGEVIPAKEDPAELHIDSAYLRLNEDINMVYAATVPKDCKDPYMIFCLNGREYKISEYTVNAEGTFCFELKNIFPQNMGDNISATLYATKDGETVCVTKAEYSIRQYCINQLKKTSDDKLKTLLSDLLTYGAAAQRYTNYRTDALVTEGIDLTPSKFEGLKSAKATFEGEKDPAADWYASTLALRNALAVRLYFTAEKTDDLTVKAAIGDRVYLFEEKDFACAEAGLYYVEVRGIKATEFDEPVSASFFRSSKPIGRTITYSVNTYISSMQDVKNEPLQMLVRALYNYGASAKAYADTNK